MKMSKTAIVVGGSMGGLFAANLLLRSGWSVNVFEKSEQPLISRGAGIVTHEGLRRALSVAGAAFEDSLGILIETRRAFDRQGLVQAEIRLPQILTSWSRLLTLLIAAFPQEHYHLNHTVASIEPGDDTRRGRVQFANGLVLEADLIVASDGLRSGTRQILFPSTRTEFAGYIAWRTVADQNKLSGSAREFLENSFSFSQAPGEQILAYPIAAPDDVHHIQTNLVWYRKTTVTELRDLLTDTSGHYFDQGIPPDRIAPRHTALAIQMASELFHPCWGEVLQKRSGPLILQPIYDLESSQMASGRLALIGDAAFVARPHIGQGVTKAAGDALALVESLSDHDDDVVAALQTFSSLRVPIGHMAVSHARDMGAPIVAGQGDALDEHLKPLVAYYSDPKHLVMETAVEMKGVAHIG